MSLFKVNCGYPGAYIEGIGVLKAGEIHDIPEFVVVQRRGRPKRIAVTPRLSWIPMDDRSWARFHEEYGNQKQKDADGRVMLDDQGREIELKDATGRPIPVAPYADQTPEPEMTPEEEDAAAEAARRKEELDRIRAEAVAEYQKAASPESKPARHSDRAPPDRSPSDR